MKTLVLFLQNTGSLSPVDVHLLELAQELASSDDRISVVSLDADETTIASGVRDTISEYQPELVLITNSALARAVSPIAAVENEFTVLSGISSITQGERWVAQRIWNKGQLRGEVVVGPKTIVLMQPGFSDNTSAIRPTVVSPNESLLTVLADKDSVKPQGLLKEAETVVSIGRGVLKADLESVSAIEELLGASRAATRQAIEEGNATGAQKVGETGHSVGPELYLALGISGANQHMSGLVDSHRVIAINNYPKAPIARECDHLIVADLGEFLPLLGEEIRQLTGGMSKW